MPRIFSFSQKSIFCMRFVNLGRVTGHRSCVQTLRKAHGFPSTPVQILPPPSHTHHHLEAYIHLLPESLIPVIVLRLSYLFSLLQLFILCGSEVLSTASTILYPIQVTMTANNDSNYKLLQGEDCVSSTPSASCPLGAGLPSEYFGYDNAFKSAKRIVIPIPAGAR